MNPLLHQSLQRSSRSSCALLGLVLASSLATASTDDGVVFLDIDRSNHVTLDGRSRSNGLAALGLWQDVRSMSRRFSQAEADQDSSADDRSADALLKASADARPHAASANSELTYDFRVEPLSSRDCTASYGSFSSSLETAFDEAASGYGYAGPMTSARINFHYDVSYSGDPSRLSWSSGEVVGLYRGSTLLSGTRHGSAGNDWYSQYLQPGSYSIEANAEIVAPQASSHLRGGRGTCEVDLGFDILEGPGWARSSLLDVSRSTSAQAVRGSSDDDASTSLAGAPTVAMQSAIGRFAWASERLDGTNNAFWGRHDAYSFADPSIRGSSATPASAVSELLFVVPGSSASRTDAVIVLEGFLARGGMGRGTVQLEVIDAAGAVRFDTAFNARNTIFGNWDSEHAFMTTLSLPGGQYTFRVTSETSIKPSFGAPLSFSNARIDCSFAVILN